ncbi:helicase HerA domain-containing protein [Mycobacteroides abscessus]|uniref:helicase HerA domain-containing protein n=1 Tax=Mycobacteroides abscessus TaxID=36809 RepID=UPI001F3F3BA4
MFDDEDDFLFGPGALSEETAEGTETETAVERAASAAQAKAQEKALTDEVDRYIELLPAIEAAKPLPPQHERPKQEVMSGAAWIAQRLEKVITAVAPPGTDIKTGSRGDTAAATVMPPAAEKGKPLAQCMLAAIDAAGNLGHFKLARAGVNGFTLRREGIGATTDPWTAHGAKAAAFHDNPESRATVWDAAGLSVPGSVKGKRRRPKVSEFGEDNRGGTVELELPGGLTIANVERARAALRQSLNAPALEVSARGVHPVLHLNTKQPAAEFPKVNPLRPAMLIRPRTEAERHAAGGELVLPLGVRADGSPILIKPAVTPHMGIFGGTGSGKTTLMTSLIDAACVQGAEVLLADGRAGKDLRKIAFARPRGVIGYAAGSQASLHRSVAYVHDLYLMRQALQDRLQREGVEYQPKPFVYVFDEWGSFIHTLSKGTKEQKAAAEATVARMEQLAAESRELRITLVLAGQHSYVSAMTGTLRENIRTLVVIGPPSEQHLAALFEGPKRDEARTLGAQISSTAKGRGIVADTVGEGEQRISMFQGFFNPAGPDADAMAAAVAKAPVSRRIGWKFPRGDEPGGDGSWMSWTPVSDPSSDNMPVIYVDDEDGRPLPDAAVFDPTSKTYSPGARPLRAAAIPVN